MHILQVEYNMDISIKNAKDLIQNQALEQNRKYINFHSVTKPKRYIPKYITDADLFLEEIMEFFNNHDFTKDVVDVIIKIAADALGINVMVYQENQGITELLEVSGCQFGKRVFVKFWWDDLNPQGNHYNPVILSSQKHLYNAKCNYNNENLQDLDTQHIDQEYSGLKTDEPEVRDEISTPTFEYGIAYYTKDNAPIYQFKMKEPINEEIEETVQKKETKEREKKERNEKQEDEQNEPLDLSLKSSSILKATPISTRDMYLPISYTMEYVTDGTVSNLKKKTKSQQKFTEQNANDW